MAIKFPSIESSIFTSAKVMCTAVKWAAVELNPSIYRFEQEAQGFNVHKVYSLTEFNPDEMSSKFNFALVRDPAARFLSLYKQKVLSRIMESKAKPELISSGLSLIPDFEQFLDQILEYKRLSKLIEHHSRPQTYFLGTDSGFYDSVHNSSDSRKLEQILSEKAQRKISFRAINVSDTSIEIAMSFWAKLRIKALYAEDYQVFGDYLR